MKCTVLPQLEPNQRGPSNMRLASLTIASALFVRSLPLLADDGNRLTYLDGFCDPYYPTHETPKLVTPQWVGEPGVELVMLLAIDDMSSHEKYENYLRPVLERLKAIDGRAPVSIMSNRPDPKEPHLQKWLGEGLTFEAHTFTHPCPLLKSGDFAKAADDYHSCIDRLATIPNWQPVAFRMTCYDSINNSNPRFYSEIFNQTTPGGHWLNLSSSMSMLFTEGDPDQPAGYATDPDGKPRFTKYTFAGRKGERTWINYIENYPYPYVIGKLCWEIPSEVPDDWQGQNLFGKRDPRIIADMKAAVDAAARKKGVFAPTFHPYDWIRNDQLVEVIDHAVNTLGKKVKALNFLEIQTRLNENLLAGESLRQPDNGQDNGVRLIDLDGDGYLDVVIGNENLRLTRLWQPQTGTWHETGFPVALIHSDANGNRHDAGVRFGVLQQTCEGNRRDGMASLLVRNAREAGGWHFDGRQWVRDNDLLNGLNAVGLVHTNSRFRDRGVRLRDLDGDGSCELLISNPTQNAVFQWLPCRGMWSRLSCRLPSGTTIVDAQGNDGGLRFVDITGDGKEDLLFSNHERYSVHRFVDTQQGWKQLSASSGIRGDRPATEELPEFVRKDGTNNGAWFSQQHLWVQNEDTDRLPDLLDRRSFKTLLNLHGSTEPHPESMKKLTIPIVDLDAQAHRQVVIDKEKGQYLGHPTTVLLEDGKTMLCVYPKGHGKGGIVYKRSTDGGLTWSERLPTPRSWATSREVPTLHRVIDPDGKKRIIMWSGLYPARLAVTENDGRTWGEIEPVGDWGGIVVMGAVEALKERGHYIAMFHDDGRFFTKEPQQEKPIAFTLYKTFSKDGGLTWSFPEAILKRSDVHLCEPGLIRSPDGTQLACLLRENSRRKNSQIIFSDDEGETWTPPRELPVALSGDRHTGKYGPDGRLFISFRDRLANGVDTATEGDWVGWVGKYQDLVQGTEGQYRVRLKDNTKGADCAYPGVEVLPDGTFVTTTYGHWDEGESPYILSVRFKLSELDALVKRSVRATTSQRVHPVLVRNNYDALLQLELDVTEAPPPKVISLSFSLEGTDDLSDIASLSLFATGDEHPSPETRVGESLPPTKEIVFRIDRPLKGGLNTFTLAATLSPRAGLNHRLDAACTRVRLSNRDTLWANDVTPGVRKRIGIALRRGGDDGVDTYRIPALARSPTGTLLCVYDVRHRHPRDLQEDIDIGLSRSLDAGRTWEPARVIMDMGEWGGMPEEQNGCSDPGIIVDQNTGDIFCWAVWMHKKPGHHQWRPEGTEAGYEIGKTAQLLMVRSHDDGHTWSKPENVTRQLKPDAWWLYAPAPNAGITLRDGTLVMPMEGRGVHGEHFSNIMTSADHGSTWQVSTPVPDRTTECQAVELADGSIMLNMRNQKKLGYRAVYVTHDRGKIWSPHETHNKTLIEPNCNASLFRADYKERGKKRSVFLFANPRAKDGRHHHTIRASFDEGTTWPESHHQLLDVGRGRGYASITQIDDDHIGIVYEGSRSDLTFEKIALRELVKK